ncbi:MAG: sugar phosphate isomerase/epimerase family protein [Rectinemataceae bacterium]
MIRIGLSSSALLTLSAHDVIAAAAGAGADAIEWAGDVHVPHDDAAAAGGVMIDTLRAGLTTASYAPLYRALPVGEHGLRFESVLEAAAELQAPIVRVFLGGNSPLGREPEQRFLLVSEARRLGDRAARRGVTVCLSLGRNTCMDSYAAAIDLASEIDHPFVRLAWEPLPGLAPDECSAALEAAGVSVALLLVRRIDRAGCVGRLEEEEADWRRRLAAFKKAELDPKMGHFVLIASVREEASRSLDAALPGLTEDVGLLRRLIRELEGPPRTH